MADRENSLGKWFGEKKIVRLMLLAALLALGVMHIQWILEGIRFLWNVFKPIIVGAIIAYILEIIIKRLEKLFFPKTHNKWLIKSRRAICIVVAAMLVLSIIALIFSTVIPGLRDAFTVLGKEFPNYYAQAEEWVLEAFRDIPTVTEYVKGLELDWESVQDRVINWAINGIGQTGLLSSTVSVIGAVTGRIANFLISAIFAIFLLGSKTQLQSQFHRVMDAALPPEKNEKVQHILDTLNRCFSGFIVGQTVNGIILGVLTWLGMRIFKMPYALMVGVLSGTASLIPIIGGYIGAALGTFLVFTASPSLALWFLLFVVTLQTVQGNVLYPRLVGNSVGIPSLWVLAAVSVGGGIGGIGGMVIAVPLTATLYALAREWVQKRNEAGRTEETKIPPPHGSQARIR